MRMSLLTFCLLISSIAAAETSTPTIKVGALAFGTLNWELAVMRAQGLDKANGISVEKIDLASPESGRIGLQGKSLDIVVSDWIWVARQRQQGQDFVFTPYSSAHGALMTANASPIRNLGDLTGKRLGVAGGGLDKNWLLLKALATKSLKLDLETSATITFGAPPLLNEQLKQGQVDAILTYWNYAAKLEAEGYRQVLGGRDLQKGLGIDADVPVLGYVFRESWAKANPVPVEAFIKATTAARRLICETEPAWQAVIPLTQETDSRVQAALRRHYCDGRVTHFGEAERKAAEQVFAWIDRSNAPSAAGAQAGLPAGVFWPVGSP